MKSDIFFLYVLHTGHLNYWFILITPMTRTHTKLLQTSNYTIKNNNLFFPLLNSTELSFVVQLKTRFICQFTNEQFSWKTKVMCTGMKTHQCP